LGAEDAERLAEPPRASGRANPSVWPSHAARHRHVPSGAIARSTKRLASVARRRLHDTFGEPLGARGRGSPGAEEPAPYPAEHDERAAGGDVDRRWRVEAGCEQRS
jgi:hypothetical protein